MRQARSEELQRWIPLPHRFQLIEFRKRIHREIAQIHLRIQTQRRLQIFRLQGAPRDLVQARAKRVHFLRLNRQSRRHGMAAVPHQQVVTFAQRRSQIKTRNAATRTAPILALAANDKRGAIKFLQHARGNDSHHADVPVELSLHNHEIRLGIEACPHRPGDFLRHRALNFLALAILRIQSLRQRHGLFQRFREQQMQRILRRLQPTRRIQARRELKAHVERTELRRGLRDLFQGDQPRPPGRAQAFQSGRNQNSVFPHQRNEVGNRSQRDEIQQWAHVEVRRARQIDFTAAFD